MMTRIRAVAAGASMASYLVFSPAAAHAAPRPPENPVCVPLAATVEHWVTVLDRTPRPVLFERAAVAVDNYVDPPRTRWLNRWIFEVGGSFQAEGLGEDFRGDLREGLTHISRLCPSLPASVASGPLPR